MYIYNNIASHNIKKGNRYGYPGDPTSPLFGSCIGVPG